MPPVSRLTAKHEIQLTEWLFVPEGYEDCDRDYVVCRDARIQKWWARRLRRFTRALHKRYGRVLPKHYRKALVCTYAPRAKPPRVVLIQREVC
jgi:hypothetical protein